MSLTPIFDDLVREFEDIVEASALVSSLYETGSAARIAGSDGASAATAVAERPAAETTAKRTADPRKVAERA
ncbi:hypothetical protein [Actinosynnema pretiosum]|uniref:Uncharacterized protein n=1 Tax=Actinosynnema pretiosum TaxID=42197 RepID=A0A290Z2J6_9PSEU|nr:hypothetical protein [Actinosynnema pretiosum]ATE53222.1 hypothetical protein CNX65_07905 [Actinosynnema pretiosum]